MLINKIFRESKLKLLESKFIEMFSFCGENRATRERNLKQK